MPAEPLVSIVMPAYNAAAYIGEAVDSVLAQTWTNWELIVVDDGSTDGTGEYLDSLTDPRIQVIHQLNHGVSAARNTALDVAKGEFITFLDADDLLPSSSLAVRANHLILHEELDIVDGIVSVRDPYCQKELRKFQPYYHGYLLPRLLRLDERVFFGPFYLLRRCRLADIRFTEGMTHAEDLLFFIQFASREEMKYGFIDEPVYLYRSGHPSAMRNMPGLEEGYFLLLKEVRFLPCVTSIDMARMRLRIARILLLSWGAAGAWWRGVRAASLALIACRNRL